MQDIDQVQVNFDSDALWVMNIALAVVMFGVALGISVNDFKSLLKEPKVVLIGILSQFVLLPFITFLVILAVKPLPSIALGMMMVAACPGGNVSNFMTHLAKGNAALSVSLTAFSTCIALVMTPFNFQFYGNLYEPTSYLLKEVALSPMDLIKVVLLIVGIPLFVGIFVRYYTPRLAIKLSKILQPFSILVFIVIVGIAFSKNIDVFKTHILDVFYLGVGHNILALALGFYVAKGFKLSFKNQKTLALETGIQNSGLGLVLIFTFFDGLGGMAIIAAFWGIWHIISGLLLAFYWAKQTKIIHEIKTV
ncbi:bile acid:sodium symporter family protein [Formosa sp. PL04]|uniref:bile acid:sodium symporter family protein n=1 Tax=Formosa sp. PL04 TaxID=3081755 RepID=UPI002981691A|nr:bile acid:sodium symporter family protein [Formosa sp. PL04]MDW5289351.1 bile acid:sodium symporter family protein [Formosa sp. PL04]